MKILGEDIKTVQFCWPVGRPRVRSLRRGLWEIRSQLERTQARILFTLIPGAIVLLHGFIKKSRRTPRAELRLARERGARIAGETQ